jgi:KDO2-lipid IV(A) lauroyltransferase
MVYRLTLLASWLAGITPRWLRLALAGPITTLVYYLWPTKRHVTIANMAQILDTSINDPEARRLARNSWRNYGRYLSDFFYLPNATSQQVVAWTRDVSGGLGANGMIDEALARGKGLIIFTAHFGAFDVAGVYVAAHAPLAVIADTFTDPRLDQLIQGQRAHFGLSVIRAEKSPRPILRHLKENGVVAIVGDRPMAPGEGTPITFFGKTCYVPGGVAQLALLSGAALAPGFAYYDTEDESHNFQGYMAEPIYPEPTGDREADTIALTQRMYDALEAITRQRPDQWYMFRPFWPDTPAPATNAGPLASEAATRG